MDSGKCRIQSNPFRTMFKLFKSKNSLPDLSRVLDVSKLEQEESQTTTQLKCEHYTINRVPCPWSGAGVTPGVDEATAPLQQYIRDRKQWRVYTISQCPGLVYIRGALGVAHQKYWIRRCLATYPADGDSVTNVDRDGSHVGHTHGHTGDDVQWRRSIWSTSHYMRSTAKEERNSKSREHGVETDAQHKKCDYSKLINKLRWVTLGYHHDWDTKLYSDTHRGVFPSELQTMCSYICASIGQHSGCSTPSKAPSTPETTASTPNTPSTVPITPYTAQAAIVNYYHMGSTLSPHTDHSEMDLTTPLMSISFGQSAIFLLGGCTLDTPPVPFLLHSGDILVMSGEARLAYHAVPRVLPVEAIVCARGGSEGCECAQCVWCALEQERSVDPQWAPYHRYIARARINVNVRQVLPHGAHSITHYHHVKDTACT